MAYATVWKYTDEDGQAKVLIGHPGAYTGTHEEAVADGRLTLETLPGYALAPVSIVETERDLEDDIQDREEIYLGPEEDQLFYDISAGVGRWHHQSWWPQV